MKYYLFVFLLFMHILHLYSQENINVFFVNGSTLRSNEKDKFYIRIENKESEPISKINIEILPNEIFTFSQTMFSIENISSKGFGTFSLDISNKKRQYFSEYIPIKLNIETPNSVQEKIIFITLFPVKYFWLTVSFIITIILVMVMSVIYIRLTKGERKNDK